MITFEQFRRVMSFDTQNRFCIEILFSVNGSEKYSECWMGKLPDKNTNKDVYWFGLTPDGQNAYDYPTFEEMLSANVFDGKSFLEIWSDISFLEVDGCEPTERFLSYLH